MTELAVLHKRMIDPVTFDEFIPLVFQPYEIVIFLTDSDFGTVHVISTTNYSSSVCTGDIVAESFSAHSKEVFGGCTSGSP